MKKKLLLFVLIFIGLRIANAADGTLTVTNVRNAVPGYNGTLEVSLTGTDVQYANFQFNIKFPDGFTYESYTLGEMIPVLIPAYNIVVTPQGSNTWQFLGYASTTTPLTAQNGVLLRLNFSVNAGTSIGTHDGGEFTTIRLAEANATTHSPADTDFSLEATNVVTLEEDETEVPAAISDVDVKVNRTLKADMWNTIVLPFAISSSQIATVFGAGTEVASFSSADVTRADGKTTEIRVNFTSLVGDMAAHTPYIIKVPTALTEFMVENVTITASADPTINMGDEEEYFKFVGTYTTNTIIPDGGLFLSDNNFKYSAGTSKLKAFHGYFNFFRKLYGYKTAAAPAVRLDVDGISTGISAQKHVSGMAVDSYYNLQGQKIAQPTKGLYIVNGKKIIIK